MTIIFGDVARVADMLFAITDYSKAGMWGGALDLFVGHPLIPATEYSRHDREIGLPGCRPLSEADWHTIPEMGSVDNLVIHFQCAYVPACAIIDSTIVGRLIPSALEDAKNGILTLMNGEDEFLKWEDVETRENIKEQFKRAIEHLWPENP